MADNTTGLPVQTITGQFVSTKLVDSGGTNVAAVSATGQVSTNVTGIGGTAPSATNPLFVELSTGSAAYTLFGQAIGSAPWTRVTDGTTTVGVIAGTTALKSDISSIGGTAPGATSVLPTRLSDGSAFYTNTGQAAATAAFSRITDGTLTATVRDTGTNDSLNVSIVDASGNQIVSFGGGSQYVGDAAATSTPTGTIAMGLANSAAPADVSANNDAVAQWMLRNGSAVVNLAVGGTLITNLGQAAANGMYMRITDATNSAAVRATVNSLNVDITSVGGTAISATVPVSTRLTDGSAYYTRTGQTQATGVYSAVSDGTTVAGVIAATTALKTDLSSVAGTATVTGGVNGSQGVGGLAAHDAAVAGNPVLVGAVSSAAAPADVTADGEAVRLWALRNGSQVVNIAAGGTLWTNMGQAAASGQFVRITNGTLTASIRDLTSADPIDVAIVDGTGAQITSFGGGTQYVGDAAATATPTGTMQMGLANATAPADVSANADAVAMWMLRNGSPVVNIAAGGTLLTNIGQAAATSTFVRINDGTTTAGVIAGTTALKTDLSSYLGTAVSATNPIAYRPSNGTAFLANLGEAAASGQYVRLTDGTDTAEIITTINSLKVDFSSIVGAVPAAANPIPVRLTDGAAFYSSASGAPTDPKYSTQTSAALGAGASATLTHYVTSGKTGQLVGIDAGSTVPCKVVINTVLTGTPTARVVLFTKPYEVYQWRAPYKTFITRASADATSGFSVTFTNKDASVAADVYSTGYWDEV